MALAFLAVLLGEGFVTWALVRERDTAVDSVGVTQYPPFSVRRAVASLRISRCDIQPGETGTRARTSQPRAGKQRWPQGLVCLIQSRSYIAPFLGMTMKAPQLSRNQVSKVFPLFDPSAALLNVT